MSDGDEEVEYIECDLHGRSQATFVCHHVTDGLHNRERVGFYWSMENPDNPYPDAWCAACEQRVERTGGEWVGEAAENLSVQVLCTDCYELAKKFHMGGDPWS